MKEKVLNFVQSGGTEGSRSLVLLNAIEALSQLSYSPTPVSGYGKAYCWRNCRPCTILAYHASQTNISPLLGLALLRRNDPQEDVATCSEHTNTHEEGRVPCSPHGLERRPA